MLNLGIYIWILGLVLGILFHFLPIGFTIGGLLFSVLIGIYLYLDVKREKTSTEKLIEAVWEK